MEEIWRTRGPLAWLLAPVALVFAVLVAVRRFLFRHGILKCERLPVPVVVVGNLTVGGAGKTPLVIQLASQLREAGKHPGIVSRGYRGSQEGVCEVMTDARASEVGDEPLLLARRSGCPVVVGRDRVAAGSALLAAHPECDVILSDDGLQHLRLARDLEVVVFDVRGAMNGWMLPAGPLREPLGRLASIDAMVLNGSCPPPGAFAGKLFSMMLHGNVFRRLDDPTVCCEAAAFADMTVHAVAGIGSPRRFFDHLSALGVRHVAHPFPDHHEYRPEHLDFAGGAIVVTEKDAVKLSDLTLALPVWVLPVTAQIEPDLARFVMETLWTPAC